MQGSSLGLYHASYNSIWRESIAITAVYPCATPFSFSPVCDILESMDYNKLALDLHKKYKGKITTSLRDNDELDRDKLSSYYSPGVGAVSKAIADDPASLPTYTWTNTSCPSLATARPS